MALARKKTSESVPNWISVRNVSLLVPLRRKSGGSSFRDPLSLLTSFYKPAQTQREVRTILDGVNLEVGDGCRLALIGRNGAGKTTLLRLMAGSVSPTRGVIEMRGTVRALLNMSLGFRNEATGLENIYLRGLSMGMGLSEIQAKIPDIIEFSELGDAIHDPIQTYSTGMRGRLAFSIVTSRTPNILLMDEWISAGDKFFVAKAQARLQAHIDECRALVLASHSASILSDICTHGFVMEGGRGAYYGKIDDALKFYDEMPRPRKKPVPHVEQA